MRTGLVGVGALLLGACGAPALTPAGSAVKLMKSDPPAACSEIGSVDAGGGDFTGGDEGAKNRLRNDAGTKGANYVRMESVQGGGKNGVFYTGTAYKCP